MWGSPELGRPQIDPNMQRSSLWRLPRMPLISGILQCRQVSYWPLQGTRNTIIHPKLWVRLVKGREHTFRPILTASPLGRHHDSTICQHSPNQYNFIGAKGDMALFSSSAFHPCNHSMPGLQSLVFGTLLTISHCHDCYGSLCF